jgi:hypothetical protein
MISTSREWPQWVASCRSVRRLETAKERRKRPFVGRGNRRGWPIAVTWRPTVIVSINNLWWPC